MISKHPSAEDRRVRPPGRTGGKMFRTPQHVGKSKLSSKGGYELAQVGRHSKPLLLNSAQEAAPTGQVEGQAAHS